MALSIQQLISRQDLDATTIREFLAEHSFPLVEGPRVTFVFQGEADEVLLQHWVYGLPSSQAFERAGSSDLWFLILELPEKSRIEYKINVVRDGNHRWIRDPLNPRLAHDPFGANSVCHTSGYETPEWTTVDREARPGTLDEIEVASTAFESTRRVLLYLPARFRRSRRYPLLVVHDGDDYLRFASLKVVLDNLIHRQEIAPIVVALVDAGERLIEYAASPTHASFIVDDLLPHLDRALPLDERPGARGLMGASFGAVASLATAWLHPGSCDGLFLQSGSFAFTDIGEHRRGPTFDPVVRFVNTFRDRPGRPCRRIFMTCGIYESLIYENRSLVPLLQQSGIELKYVEARDGHNWENWRDRLREGLSWLYPGPLWMVYE
jgi:enterochelin esterase family protein